MELCFISENQRLKSEQMDSKITGEIIKVFFTKLLKFF